MVMLLWLALETRTFHPVPLAQLATTVHTHVRVCGLVTLVKKEADGDTHIRLSAGKLFAVAEIIPELPLPAPKKGQRICVEGISRDDKAHKWPEVHPTLRWKLQGR